MLIKSAEFYVNFITFFDVGEANAAGTFQRFIKINYSF